MARSHGRISTGIWKDADWRALTPMQQWMYQFLLSQPNLTHAGLLPLTVRRWSSAATGVTPSDIRHALAALDNARFVVIDEDAEEVLIRTLVRNDGVWKQPKVMVRMGEDAREITSDRLRAALVQEMHRLPLHELKPDTRAVVEGVVKGIVAEFSPGPDSPPDGDPGTPGGRVPGRVSDTPSDTPGYGYSRGVFGEVEERSEEAFEALVDTEADRDAAGGESPQVSAAKEGYAEGYPEGSDIPSARARAGTPNPQPPTPQLHKSSSSETAEPPSDNHETGEHAEPIRHDVERVCRALADAVEANGSKRPTITQRWRDAARLMIDKDRRTVDQILACITWCQGDDFWRGNVMALPKLREKYDQLRLAALRQQRQNGGRALAPTGTEPDPGRPMSTTDRKVADAMALADRLLAEEQQQ